jgi:hypothetical protein
MNPKLPLPPHVIDALTSIRDRRVTGMAEICVKDGIVRDVWVTRERVVVHDGRDIAKRDKNDA